MATSKYDLINQKFGKLRVIKSSDNNSHNKKIKWICECECGNITEVEHSNLTSGHTQSCGHCGYQLIPNTRRYDLTNYRFGRLMALKPLEKSKWLCGCYKSYKTTQVCLVDLTGRKYGKLTVLSKADVHIQPNGSHKTRWNCVCDCGNYITTYAYSLTTGACKSCGCIKSTGEINVIEYLQCHNIEYEYQKKFDNLKGINNYPLSYDFYIPCMNLLIECQGQQHYYAVEMFGGQQAFEYQQEHDNRKRTYASENHIDLLEISYIDYKNIDEIINNYLKENKKWLSLEKRVQ